MRVAVLSRAQHDIDEQAGWYEENAGLETALRFIARAETTIALIASQPLMGRRRYFRNPSLAGCRWALLIDFPDHIVFYRPADDQVEVLRVLHGNRDLRALLGDFTS